MLAHIGDVVVVFGEPPEGNPYRAKSVSCRPEPGNQIIGARRRVALWLFQRDGKVDGHTFWYAPSCGGARRLQDRRLQDATEVDWSSAWAPSEIKEHGQ